MPSSTDTPPMTDVRDKRVLVSGASFAGLATAYWLNRLGHIVTIVETADGLRRGGTPVDIEGETIEILRRMGVADAVRAKALPSRGFEFKDADDSTLGSIGIGAGPTAHERYEIHRDDLLDILSAAVEDKVEVMFGQSIAGLYEGADGVSVTFSTGDRRDSASHSRKSAFAG